MPPLRQRRPRRRAILSRVRQPDRRRRLRALRLAGRLHPAASRPAHPRLARGARGRAQAGDRAVRRHPRHDRGGRRPRSRGDRAGHRPGARADDGGGAPLRGHRQPGDGRRDHGALRRAARQRGPRGARLLRGPAHAGADARLRRRAAALARAAAADPGGPQLGRGGGALHRQRSLVHLHRGGPDRAPGRAHGADGQARLDPGHRAHRRAGAGPRGHARPRAGAGARPPGAGRRARDQRGGADPLATRRRLAARALAARGARDGAGPPRRGDRRDAGGHRPGRVHGGRRGSGQVASLPRVRPALPGPGLSRHRGARGLLRPRGRLPAGGGAAPPVLPGGERRRRRRRSATRSPRACARSIPTSRRACPRSSGCSACRRTARSATWIPIGAAAR